MGRAVCSIDGCPGPVVGRGWCNKHYQRWTRTGDPTKLLGRDNIVRRDAWEHGSRRGYDLGCRCFPCRMGNKRYQDVWRSNGGTRVPVGQVLEHVERLVASGWSKAAIQRHAGLGNTTLWYMTSGRQATVNPSTATAILAIRPLDAEPHARLDDAPEVAGLLDNRRIAARIAEILTDADMSLGQLRASRKLTGRPYEVRAAIARLLRDEGWSLPQIGKVVKRHHTTVMALIRPRQLEAVPDIPADRTGLCEQCDQPSMGGGRWCLPHFQQQARKSA